MVRGLPDTGEVVSNSVGAAGYRFGAVQTASVRRRGVQRRHISTATALLSQRRRRSSGGSKSGILDRERDGGIDIAPP